MGIPGRAGSRSLAKLDVLRQERCCICWEGDPGGSGDPRTAPARLGCREGAPDPAARPGLGAAQPGRRCREALIFANRSLISRSGPPAGAALLAPAPPASFALDFPAGERLVWPNPAPLPSLGTMGGVPGHWEVPEHGVPCLAQLSLLPLPSSILALLCPGWTPNCRI